MNVILVTDLHQELHNNIKWNTTKLNEYINQKNTFRHTFLGIVIFHQKELSD